MSLPLILYVLVWFVFSALYSGAETGSYMINRIRLRRRVQHRRRSARVLSWVLRDPHIFVFSVLIGQNIAVYMVTTTVTYLYINSGMDVSGGARLFGVLPWNAEMAATLTLTFPLFLFGEVGPKNLFRMKADKLMYLLAGLLRLSVICFYPLTFPLKHFFHLLTRRANEEVERELHRLSPDALKEYFSAGAKDGVISPYQSQMMDNVTSMHSIPLRNLMTPLRQTPRLPHTATVADFKRLIARRGTSDALLMHGHRVVGMV
ncbi:MAG: DUF21 domain-containing protein, partial [Kiritimatiellales bacterium]|nr:DUF21 domain-containing protein [Kiritimatiellales bacterium]